jgi:hypothetical protein
MQFVAPMYTHVPAGVTFQRIGDAPSSGENSTIIVYGITVSNSSAGGSSEIVLYEEDETTIITKIRVATIGSPNCVRESMISFIAKNGLKVTTPGNGSCTIYHSNTGV